MMAKEYGLLHIESGIIVQRSYGINWLNSYYIAIKKRMLGSQLCNGWEEQIIILERDIGYNLYSHSPNEFEIFEMPERNLDD